jgi:cysteine-rich repeat protein
MIMRIGWLGIILGSASLFACGDQAVEPSDRQFVDAGTGMIIPGNPDPFDAGQTPRDSGQTIDAARPSACPEDDHGETRRGASWVGDPSRTGGRINCATDLDLFRFSANRARIYRIHVEGIDVACTMERQAGEIIASSDGERCDLRIELALGNTYFVGLELGPEHHNLGAYTLVIEYAGDEPPPPPAHCGDGQLDDGEACDDGNANDQDTCRNNCMRAICGDGVVWLGVETCDDGNQFGGDGCSAQCQEEGGQINQAPGRPTITIIGEATRSVDFSGIEVRLGRDPEGQLVQAICWSSGSNHSTEARAFESPFGRGGQTVEATLSWSTTGSKSVYCKTRDQQRALSASDRETVTVAAPNRSPSAPRITVDGAATSNQAFEFTVQLGRDPDGDQVQALCWSSGSDHSTERNGVPSAFVNSGRTTVVSLTWRSSGSRTIYCRTRDEHDETSGTWDTERVQVENPNRAPSRPTISSVVGAVRRQPVAVEIRLGRDPDSDNVRAKCWSSGSDYRTEGNAALSDWSSGGRTVTLQFTWSSSGSKSLYCDTEDEHAAVSTSSDRESVRVAN